MSSRTIFALALIVLLAAVGCERRDIGGDAGSNEESSNESSADNSSDAEQNSERENDKKDDASVDESDDESGDDGAGAKEEAASPADAEPAGPRWKKCEDGAARALLCDFAGGGGAALCASSDFVELRLARPDGRQSIHRHRGGPATSVERCEYTSPQRSDESWTFYEAGQRLMVHSHYVNPDSGYDDGASGDTDWSITLDARGAEAQTFQCDTATKDAVQALSESGAVAVRPGSGQTCDTLRAPTLASVRGSTHQARTGAPTCGGEPAPDAFIERIEESDIERMVFSAGREDADRDKRAEFTDVSITDSRGEASHSIASCAEFFSRVRASDSSTVLGRAPYQVRADFMKWSYNGHPIVDASSDICMDFCAQESARAGDFISSDIEALSLVGPVLSYKRSTSEAMAGGPPYHGDQWGAIDLRTMQAARFDALIDPESILTALGNDSYIRRHDTLSDTVANAETMEAALDAMRNELDGVDAYSFDYYNERKNLVAMRIPFREDTAGLSPNRMSQIGIWVSPKDEWIPYFKAARDAPDGGFYMSNYELGF